MAPILRSEPLTYAEPIARLAQDLRGRLILVRVDDDPAGIGAALDYLPRVQARVAAQHPSLSVDADVRIGDAAYGIAETVALNNAALVVMATHGRSGARRAIFGRLGQRLDQYWFDAAPNCAPAHEYPLVQI